MSAGTPATIGIIGTSWRAQYYLRVASLRPDLFRITRALTRSTGSAERATAEWDIPAGTNLAAFLASGPYDYVVVAVPRGWAPTLITEVVRAGFPVLAETPPAADLAGLVELYARLGADAPVQVAEQYQFQPQHRARLEVVRAGLIGPIGSARVSIAHGYHGASMLRLALGVGFEPVEVEAEVTVDRVVTVRGREGWADELKVNDSVRTTAKLVFGPKVGVYEFNGEQYFSPIRSRHITISGQRGEIVDDEVHYIVGPGHAVSARLVREQTGIDGDLEGEFLRSISLGERRLYQNPFAPARLSDDELAVAECMARMHSFTQGGPAFYGLADASHDHYLSVIIEESAKTGAKLTSEPQPWSRVVSLVERDGG
jgi:predicted dehydrogenase